MEQECQDVPIVRLRSQDLPKRPNPPFQPTPKKRRSLPPTVPPKPLPRTSSLQKVSPQLNTLAVADTPKTPVLPHKTEQECPSDAPSARDLTEPQEEDPPQKKLGEVPPPRPPKSSAKPKISPVVATDPPSKPRAASTPVEPRQIQSLMPKQLGLLDLPQQQQKKQPRPVSRTGQAWYILASSLLPSALARSLATTPFFLFLETLGYEAT